MKTTTSNFNAIEELERQIRLRLVLFVVGLVVSGLTAFPIEWELQQAHQWIVQNQWSNFFTRWIEHAYQGVCETNARYAFISYGSDWLGFAHLVIAIACIGPLRDPVRNLWVVEFGIISCLAIFPFAFVAGYIREIPVFWRLIDCMFGMVGGLILWRCYRSIKSLEKIKLFMG
jgi:hypothetical protein